MFTNKTIEEIVELNKKGVKVYLTPAGYIEFFRSIKDEEINVEGNAV